MAKHPLKVFRVCGIVAFCVMVAYVPLVGAVAQAAEWVNVGGTHKFDRYVDMTTIGVSGQRVTLWTVRDFRVERAIPRGPYRSIRIKRQYDCHGKKSRSLHQWFYKQAMGQGRVLYAAQATREWSRVIPGSDDEAEMKVACRSVLASRGIR